MKYIADLLVNNDYIFKVEVELSEDNMHMLKKEFEKSLSDKATELTGKEYKIELLALIQIAQASENVEGNSRKTVNRLIF